MSQSAMSNPESADYKCTFAVTSGVLAASSHRRRILTNHEDRSSSVEAGPVRVLPNVLDLVRVPADKPLCEVFVCALDCLGVAFEGPFAPADDALLSLDAHEKPSRGHAERLSVNNSVNRVIIYAVKQQRTYFDLGDLVGRCHFEPVSMNPQPPCVVPSAVVLCVSPGESWYLCGVMPSPVVGIWK